MIARLAQKWIGFNPLRRALACLLGAVLLAAIPGTASAVCSTTSTALCVQGNRFKVEIAWKGFGNDGGAARVVSQQTGDSGLFYFFGPNNWEILVKVLDACSNNNRYWVFAASATTLQYTLTVTDTQTGAVRSYFNPLGNPAAAITDTEAFATCGGGGGGGNAQVRYLNNLTCYQQGFTSTLSANGFAWTSFSGTPSSYQAVNRTSLGPTFVETNNSGCPNANYSGTLSLTPGRRYALVQTIQGNSRVLQPVDEGAAEVVEGDASPDLDVAPELPPAAAIVGEEVEK